MSESLRVASSSSPSSSEFFCVVVAMAVAEEKDEEVVVLPKKITIGVCVMEKKVKCDSEVLSPFHAGSSVPLSFSGFCSFFG